MKVFGLGKSKSPVIEFIAKSEADRHVFDPPVPAAKNIPEWYKKTAANLYNDGLPHIDKNTGNPPRTIKACMPVFDSMTAGYHILLPADIHFEDVPGGNTPSISWSTDQINPIDLHDKVQFEHFDQGPEYYPYGIKLNNIWTIKTPPGYSCLFIQPSMRDDLPFSVIPGVVDTDTFPSPINFPTFFKKGFTGTLEMGTPIVQVIPFKREEWKSTVSHYDDNYINIEWQRAKRKIYNRYKTFYRQSKSWR
jgi:hypothetical protein